MDMKAAEVAAHAYFYRWRIDKKREFFKVELEYAKGFLATLKQLERELLERQAREVPEILGANLDRTPYNQQPIAPPPRIKFPTPGLPRNSTLIDVASEEIRPNAVWKEWVTLVGRIFPKMMRVVIIVILLGTLAWTTLWAYKIARSGYSTFAAWLAAPVDLPVPSSAPAVSTQQARPILESAVKPDDAVKNVSEGVTATATLPVEAQPALESSSDTFTQDPSSVENLSVETLTNLFRNRNTVNKDWRGKKIRVSSSEWKLKDGSARVGKVRCQLATGEKVSRLPAGMVVMEGVVKGKTFWKKSIEIEACRVQ